MAEEETQSVKTPKEAKAGWGPCSPHLTLLLFAAVDGNFYEAKLSFTTNPNE